MQYHVKSEYGKCFCVVGWQEFYETFGGNVFLCHQAVDKLRQQFELGQERLFDPFNVRGNAEVGDLVATRSLGSTWRTWLRKDGRK